MKEKTKTKLRKVRRFYIVKKAQWQRGFGDVNDIFVFFQLSVIAGLGIELWNDNLGDWLEIPMNILPVFMVLLAPTIWFVGWLDQEKLHLHQAESEYASSHLNPITRKIIRIDRDVNIIKRKINKLLKEI